MTIRNLKYMFNPQSVAVIGASKKANSVGATVMRSLLQGGFDGAIIPVTPNYKAVAGVLAFPDVASLPEPPDLAVICTPPSTVPGLIAELGDRGTRAAIVLTAGLERLQDDQGRSLQQAMLDAAKPHLLRILGPNCLGLMIPRLGLNASFAHTNPLPGQIAFITQSGAMATAVLDWATANGLGFSNFVSLGNSADVDFGDVIDFLGSDPHTRSILLYIESITGARKFMSAARAAARNKPVIAIKAGRVTEGAQAVMSHTGALAGADDVVEAALERAGILRVETIEDLFDAVETLARARPVMGERVAIVTSGGGPGVIATDKLIRSGGNLATLSDDTLAQLNSFLLPNWSRRNPVDILEDAPAEHYVRTLETLLAAPDIDAILFIHAPTAIVSSRTIAQTLAPVAKAARRTVLTCWLGKAGVAEARQIFTDVGLPTYDTPEDAVGALMQLVNYRRNQELLIETPPSVPVEFTPNVAAARSVIDAALAAGQTVLTEPEAKAVLAAYEIPTVETAVATTPDECVQLAQAMTFPVVVKILSPDITHKSNVGGVALDLDTPEEVRAAAAGMLKRLKKRRPQARVSGFSVQQMARRPDAHELIVGATTDPVFGPVILFGQGGIAVEIIHDRAVSLPPLNLKLARELVNRTRVSRLLAGYSHRPPADMTAIYLTLMKVAQLVTDLPEVVELDINPLFADNQGVLALDARMRIVPTWQLAATHLAIRPYPQELEETIVLRNRPVLLRPIRPEDEPQHQAFLKQLTEEDIQLRFFVSIREFAHSDVARFTQIDYDRAMAFIATRPDDSGQPETLGVVRSIADPDNHQAEFAMIVRSDLKGMGLGRALLDKMIRYCRHRGMDEIIGETMRVNTPMIRLSRKCGFEVSSADDETVFLRLNLKPKGSASSAGG
ncbi:MAG TPA: bifunctional acetate--CoA ligase family protein/GNAT family N-acetyltransferase [Anaerolineae bacterium]|nr:bifunctional acetate--CoA ligase family protein/GNAT family N-acetyltransferase [Anaerolineae bacterium]